MKNKNNNENTAKRFVETLTKLLDEKRSDVFPQKYSTGGQLLAGAAGLIPGIGGVISPIISLIDQQKTALNQEIPETKPMMQGTNLYGNQMANGGMVTKNFKQYNTGSHVSGNDLNIDVNGVPSLNGKASVQGRETSYSNKAGETYVHSNELVNPETGNTFNIDAAKLNKKFKNADKFFEDKNALEFGMKRLSILNDRIRSIKESVEMACGGNTKKMAYGGGPDDPVVPSSENAMWDAHLNDIYLDSELSVPLSNSMIQPQSMGELIDPSVPPLVKKNQDLTVLPPDRRTNKSTTSLNLDSLVDNNAVATRDGIPGTSLEKSTEFDYNIPAVLLKTAGLIKSGMDARRPAEKEDVILPDYRKSDKEMYSTSIDYTQAKQDALAAANLAGNVNRSASGSFEQFQGRQANNYANYADAIGRISMKEALDRNQQYVQRAGYEQGKAVDTANREYQNRINNQQNEANARFAQEKFYSELTDVGSQFNKYQVYRDMLENKREIANATINEGLAIIGNKYSNFGFSEDFIDRIKSGTASTDELIKFMSTTQEIKSGTKTKTNAN